MLIPIGFCLRLRIGALAQLGEHLLCKQGVNGSIPLSSTIFGPDAVALFERCAPDGPPSRVFCFAKTRDRRRPLALRSFASLAVEAPLSSEEIKVCTTHLRLCLFCKIVKRRLIWMLPGIFGV